MCNNTYVSSHTQLINDSFINYSLINESFE